MNDNYPDAVPAIDADALPAECQGRVTIIIEIRDGDSIKMNGAEMSLRDGATMMERFCAGGGR